MIQHKRLSSIAAVVLGLILCVVGSGAVALADAQPSPIVVGYDTISNLSLNGVPGTQLTVAPGTDVSLTASWSDYHPSFCAGCVDFLPIAYQGSSAPAGCLENFGYTGASGTNTVDLGAAPETPGTYNVVAFYGMWYSCGQYWDHLIPSNFAVIAQIVVVIPSPPTADAAGPYSGVEGSPIAINGSASDPDDDTVTSTWSYTANPGTNGTCTFADSTALKTTVNCTDDGSYTLTLSASDGVSSVVTSTTQLTVGNAPITMNAITGLPTTPTRVGTAAATITASVTFTDPGTADSHTATWNWGDGTVDASLPVTETAGGRTANDSHTYTTAGVYTVSVSISDGDNPAGAGSRSFQSVVVYNPAAGFITGGGWISSPAGAYTTDPTLTGKVTFGFVAKYRQRAIVPTGISGFEFRAGNFDFHSTNYQWLVINKNGKNAQLRGTGTINGDGSYTFMIWATQAANGNPASFRIQITNNRTAATVYDNGVEQAIEGGSIVIHSWPFATNTRETQLEVLALAFLSH